MAERTLIISSFSEESKAYQGLSLLKQLNASGQIRVDGAAVLARNADGQLIVADAADRGSGMGSATGGLIGAIVGILGGPLGVLLGWGYGSLIGMTSDIADLGMRQAMLVHLGEAIKPGTTGLIAEVEEPTTEPIDTALGGIGGVITRRAAAEVADEIESAVEAQAAAEREARRVIREQKWQERRQKVEEGFSNLGRRIEQRVDNIRGKATDAQS